MPLRHTALAVLVAAVWGLNFVVIEVGLDHFPPLLFSALRFLVAALPAVLLVGPPRVAWKWVLGVGLVLGVVKFGLLFIGMNTGMPAGFASLVLQGQAVFTALFAAFLLAEKPGRRRVLGLGVAVAGIVVAAFDQGAGGPVGAFMLTLGAAACWGLSNVITRKASPPDMFRFMVWVSVVPPLPLLALSAVFEGPDAGVQAFRALSWSGIGALLYVAWAATIFGFGVWGYLLRTYDASAVAPYSLLVPVFGMSSSALLLGESVSGLRWIAAVFLVGGVAIASLPGRGSRQRPGRVERSGTAAEPRVDPGASPGDRAPKGAEPDALSTGP